MAAFWGASLIMGNDTVPDMPDRYQQFVDSLPGRLIAEQLGLPKPVRLRRFEPGQPLLEEPALVGGAPGGRLTTQAIQILEAAGAEVLDEPVEETRYGALVYDASAIGSADE